MRIRYSRVAAILFLVFVPVFVVLTWSKIALGRWSMPDLCFDLVAIVACSTLGIGFIVRPLGELTDTELTVRALFGRRRWRYPTDQLHLVERGIHFGEKRIVERWLTNRDDWRSLVQRVPGRGG